MPTKALLVASAALALALPAIAQQALPPQPATGPAAAAPVTNGAAPASQPGAAATQSPSTGAVSGPADESIVEELNQVELPPPPPPVEYPARARRDPWIVGPLEPSNTSVGGDPWQAASGAFLSTLMRRMETPIASRWAHIALRDALLVHARAPRDVDPVDWAAERAWLLLRLGEADGARMLVAGVDTDRFTPKMVQVAVQSALANADVPALCPIQDGIRRYEQRIGSLVTAMCSSLGGEPENAAAQIDDARRHGRVAGIDLTLPDKIVGAGANTGRAVTIEWEPVDELTSWRFGLATATGMVPPDRLMENASSQLRAFQARAPLLSAQQRLGSALVAAGLGVFSSQSLVDLYSQIYDSTDPSDLPSTDAWQLRQAFVGKDQPTKIDAIRHLLGIGKSPLEKEAAHALVAHAASLIEPDPKLGKDAAELISAMLAGGYDRAAARWAPACARIDGIDGDRCWAMVALAAPTTNGIEVSSGRIGSFIGRDKSPERVRSALLVAGLAGLGRINERTANALNQRYGLGLGHRSSWTQMIDAAARLGQRGTVVVMAGTGMQTTSFDQVPSSHLYHAVSGLERTGQDFIARMIAAEALSRT